MAISKRGDTDDFEDDFDEDFDSLAHALGEPEHPDGRPPHRGRDWRDIERYREARELRALIDDDLALDLD